MCCSGPALLGKQQHVHLSPEHPRCVVQGPAPCLHPLLVTPVPALGWCLCLVAVSGCLPMALAVVLVLAPALSSCLIPCISKGYSHPCPASGCRAVWVTFPLCPVADVLPDPAAHLLLPPASLPQERGVPLGAVQVTGHGLGARGLQEAEGSLLGAALHPTSPGPLPHSSTAIPCPAASWASGGASSGPWPRRRLRKAAPAPDSSEGVRCNPLCLAVPSSVALALGALTLWHAALITRGETSIERHINKKERQRLQKKGKVSAAPGVGGPAGQSWV